MTTATITRPIDVATADSMQYLASVISFANTRVLEVGCGDGDLALAMQRQGARVRAIDSSTEAIERALPLGVDAVCHDILTYRDDPFDVVLFTRSLHHIEPLPQAVTVARGLLKPGGKLILEEFAGESATQPAITWLYELRTMLATAGQLKAQAKTAPLSDPLGHWHHHHFGEHKIATGAAVIEAVQAQFNSLQTSSCAHLYRYIVRDLRDDELGAKLAEQALSWEQRLLADGAFPPIGLRLVATNS